MNILDKDAQDLLFNNARTYSHWTDAGVEDDVLKQIYEYSDKRYYNFSNRIIM